MISLYCRKSFSAVGGSFGIDVKCFPLQFTEVRCLLQKHCGSPGQLLSAAVAQHKAKTKTRAIGKLNEQKYTKIIMLKDSIQFTRRKLI